MSLAKNGSCFAIADQVSGMLIFIPIFQWPYGLEAKILASALLIWPWKMCCPIQNNIGCIHYPFLSVLVRTVQCELRIGTVYAVKLSELGTLIWEWKIQL